MSGSKVYRGRMNMESLIIYASQKHMEKTGETRKYQNYPNLGIGARGISTRNRIYNKVLCCNSQITYTIPTAPTGVTVTSRDSTSMTLSISYDGTQVTDYEVTLTSVGLGIEIKRTTTSKNITISGLPSDTYYSISVIASNPAGDSPPYSETYNSNNSPYYTTVAPPTSLSVTNASTTQLTIRFTPPSQSVNVLSYTVSYSSTLGTSTIADISGTDLTIGQDNNYLYAIIGLTPGILYTIMVYAVGSSGNSSSITVAEDTLTEPPSNLILTANSTSSIGISYTAPSLSSTIDKYIITYGVYGSSSTTSIDIAKNITSYTLTGLSPNVQYTISVVTNNKGSGSTVNSAAVTGDKYTLPNPPSSVSSSDITYNSVVITIAPPSELFTASSFILTYYPTSTPSSSTILTDAPIINTITGLSASTDYTVKVKSANGDTTPGYSSEITTTFTTSDSPLVAPGVPTNLETASKTDDSITVSYNGPSTGGIVSNYYIQYMNDSYEDSESNWTEYGSTLFDNETYLTYTIPELSSNTTYYIRVKATNSTGSSSYATITVTTDATDVYVPKNFTDILQQPAVL